LDDISHNSNCGHKISTAQAGALQSVCLTQPKIENRFAGTFKKSLKFLKEDITAKLISLSKVFWLFLKILPSLGNILVLFIFAILNKD